MEGVGWGTAKCRAVALRIKKVETHWCEAEVLHVCPIGPIRPAGLPVGQARRRRGCSGGAARDGAGRGGEDARCRPVTWRPRPARPAAAAAPSTRPRPAVAMALRLLLLLLLLPPPLLAAASGLSAPQDPGVTTTSQKPSEHSNQTKNVIRTTSLDPPETASTSQSANGTQPVNTTQSANGTQPVSTTQSANGTQPVTTTKAANSTQSASTTQTTTTAISKPQTSMPSKPNITVTTASTPSTSASVSVTVAQARTSRFDVGSFVGGIVLTLGMLAILYIGCKTYHSRRGIRYRTIDEHDAII